jgi:hypothetical protein
MSDASSYWAPSCGYGAERQLDLPMDDDCIAPSMRLGDLA